MKNLPIVFILAALFASACGGPLDPQKDVADCDDNTSFTLCEEIITVNILMGTVDVVDDDASDVGETD